jgi:hypothetical protein
VFATGFVMPAIAIVPAALFARVQPPGSVTVTTPLAAEAVVALQPLKLPPKVTDGEAGIPVHVADGKVMVTVFPAVSAPVEVAVKPTVHVDDAEAVAREPAKVTEPGPVVRSASVCAIHGCEEPSEAVEVPVDPIVDCSAVAATPAPSPSFETGLALEATE